MLHTGGGEEWGSEEGDNTMVKVLCSQRDRFRDKAHQLELQLAQVSNRQEKRCCLNTQQIRTFCHYGQTQMLKNSLVVVNIVIIPSSVPKHVRLGWVTVASSLESERQL